MKFKILKRFKVKLKLNYKDKINIKYALQESHSIELFVFIYLIIDSKNEHTYKHRDMINEIALSLFWTSKSNALSKS